MMADDMIPFSDFDLLPDDEDVFPEPPADGAVILDQLHAGLGRYVVFPSPEAHDAMTAWTAATHAQDAWETAPRAALVSAEKRSGKSRLMDIVEATCNRPLVTVNISPAALVRCIVEATILVDEADTIFGRKAAESSEDLRGIINAGFGRNRPYIRWDIKAREAEECPTFAMAMLASIGDLPDTIMDRAIIIRMRRRLASEPLAPFRTRRDAPALHDLRDRLHEWICEHLGELADAEPDMPVEDRAADTWEPLIAIADLAGGHWPARIRNACTVMVATADATATEGSLGQKLLADVRDVFNINNDVFVSSRDLVERLHRLDDTPWIDLNLSMNGLARKLQRYGIRPRQDATKTMRGYHAADFADAFARYVASATVQLSETDPEQGEQSDTSAAANCPANCPEVAGDSCPDSSETAYCPAETAGQTPHADSRTVADGPDGPDALQAVFEDAEIVEID